MRMGISSVWKKLSVSLFKGAAPEMKNFVWSKPMAFCIPRITSYFAVDVPNGFLGL